MAVTALGFSPALSAESGRYDLGTLPGGVLSSANGVSADGSVVVGYSDSLSGFWAFRWEDNGDGGSMQDLGTLSGGFLSGAHGVNADGSVIVGQTTSNMAFLARVSAAGSGSRVPRERVMWRGLAAIPVRGRFRGQRK